VSGLRVVALETSGAIGSVCLVEGENILAERSFARGLEHGRMLVAVLREACISVGWQPRRDVQLVAVSQGPGSFTGLRVGIAAAKTIAFVVGCPIVGVSSLEVLVANAPVVGARACAILDAKRGQVYAALFAYRAGAWARETEDLLITPRALLERIGPPAYLVGDGLRAYPEAFSAPGYTCAPASDWVGRASVVARLGLRGFAAGRMTSWRELTPIYHRPPEAEEKLLRREGLAAKPPA